MAVLVHGDDRLIATPDNASLTTVERAIANPGIDMEGDRFEVDFAGFGHAQFLKQALSG